ncbi:response regulator [bacterium]|nr:response regulator [bacterium]
MKRIMVVEDDPQVRRLLKDLLELEGYIVEDTPNGKVATERFRREPTQLVITDIIMPEKDGLETIREIRGEFPDVKIIAISGGGRGGQMDYLKMAETLGAEYTFEKPVEIRSILQTVRGLLANTDA